jgi:hypothetical protein
MASLDSVISAIFEDSNSNSQIRRQYFNRNTSNTPITVKKYMEIPINSDVFELPLFAFEDFKKMHQNKKIGDVIVASLYSCGQTSNYKSLDSIMKDVLSTYFDKHLCKVQVANSPNTYYTTFGAVFDENFTPLMMLSWIMERRINEEGVIKYRYKKPLLRLNPYPCLNKEDALQKFICGRWMTTALGTRVYTPSAYYCRDFIEQSGYLSFNHVKIEIDECPFVIRGTEVPSISVTNEGLLQLAAEHIDEILQ